MCTKCHKAIIRGYPLKWKFLDDKFYDIYVCIQCLVKSKRSSTRLQIRKGCEFQGIQFSDQNHEMEMTIVSKD